ncbi:hypothetical protein AB0O67_36730 [Streptomyces sp. NPDC086077]
MSSFELAINTAKAETEVATILQDRDLSEKDLPDGRISGLPSDEFPTT